MKSARTMQRSAQSGFVMLEMLASILLTVVILTALATVTSQWMPNWNRGMTQIQQMERLGIGLDRAVNDLASAQYVPIGGRLLAFDGMPTSVTFVRTAIGPALRPGLEFVRLVQRSDEQGLALVRERSPFTPFATAASLQFSDPVTLIRSPYRISFAYADAKQNWSPEWHSGVELPKMVQILVRETMTDRTIVASTIAVIPVDVSSECARVKNISQCLAGRLEQNEPEL